MYIKVYSIMCLCTLIQSSLATVSMGVEHRGYVHYFMSYL